MKPPNERPSWDHYFMKLAEIASTRSPDPTKQVGAILVHSNRILSQGYNGLPQGIDEKSVDWGNREFIRKIVIHAEINCLLYSQIIPPKGSVLYCTLSPCMECLKVIKAYNINTVYFKEEYKNYTAVLEVAKFFNITLIQV